MVVIATFFLPLAMALFFGRAFCGGVCALGALAARETTRKTMTARDDLISDLSGASERLASLRGYL